MARPFRKLICKYLVSLAALLMGTTSVSFAQGADTQRLLWEVSGFHNNANNDNVTLASHFESSTELIRWTQKNGAVVYDFQVTGTTGQWADVNTDGEMTFAVSFRSGSGTIHMVRRHGSITIEIRIVQDGKNILPYTFFVSSVSTL